MPTALIRILMLALVGVTLTQCAGEFLSQDRPNVVLIFTDDMGYGDLGSYGARLYRTPALDRMAAEGARFTDFYVPQSLCSASRAALLTGMYPNRIGINGALAPWSGIGLGQQETTLAEMFKSRGYATAHFGKWHLGSDPESNPLHHGFDEFYGIPHSNDMWPFHPESPQLWPDLPTMQGMDTIGLNTDQTRFTTDFTARSIAFMEAATEQQEPFFIYLAHPMPHVPLFVSAERSGSSGAGLYADVVQEIDWSVGQIMSALERLNIVDDTLVMFVSDNGPWLSYGNHAGSTAGLREGKGTTWEGGVRVPFIARWPHKIPQNLEVSTPAMTIDLWPTLASVVGAPMPEHAVDGESIWPLLSGESTDAVQEAYYFYGSNNQLQSLRSGKWKLHFPHRYRTMAGQDPGLDGLPGSYNNEARAELSLFDLSVDPFERRNLAADNVEVVRRLESLADGIRAQLGDALTGVVGNGIREPAEIENPSYSRPTRQN